MGGKKRVREGGERYAVNGIVLDRRAFFLHPGPSSSFLYPSRFRSPRRPERRETLSGATSTTTSNGRPQKNSSNLSLPVAYYQSPRQSQIGLLGPVCAVDSRQDLDFCPWCFASTFRNHPTTCTRIDTHTGARHSDLQVRLSTARLTTDVRTFHPAAERKNRRKKVSLLYDVDFFSPTID